MHLPEVLVAHSSAPDGIGTADDAAALYLLIDLLHRQGRTGLARRIATAVVRGEQVSEEDLKQAARHG
jgi:hypothetical protein